MADNLEFKYAWAAGFMDGDGCFSLLSPSGKGNFDPATRRIYIGACQVNPEPLIRLQTLLDGNVRKLNKRVWQWSISGSEKAKFALPLLIPHLVTKKREAEIVLAYSHLVKRRGRRGNGMPSFAEQEFQERISLIEELARIRLANKER